MPYDNVSQLPEYVKKYSAKLQRQWMHVFNSVYKKVLNETDSKKEADERAFKAANSILKKRFKSKGSYGSDERADYFSYLIDSMLNNLKG